ncbi:MAG: S9 family peptidase [Bacteroidetes bacterium HGW-Bacteroidetes-11]|nr:MAG: S9 family peptidase [Bacteroidetes bacterium HGW-Bacteroidetes-11]
MKRLILLLTMTYGLLQAQTPQQYQLPPQEILELVDISPRPFIRIDSRNRTMVMLQRQTFKTLEEMAADEVKLAGLRINPATNGPARANFTYGISITDIATGNSPVITGLPEKLKISDFSFSPDETKIAFTNTVPTGIELWTLDLQTGVAMRITSPVLNGSMGMPYTWLPASDGFLVLIIPQGRQTLGTTKEMPIGPAVQETSGRKAPVRTYQDLLRNPADEILYEHYTQSEVVKIDFNSSQEKFLPKAIYRSLQFSPDGQFLLSQVIVRPYSYIVPSGRFPSDYNIHNSDGKLLKNFYQKPLIEELPTGFDAVETGKRSISWRADAAATLCWAEARDGGDPAVEAEFRDNVFMLNAPFDGQPTLLASTKNRFAGFNWGNEEVAILYDYWWKTRRTSAYLINPSAPTQGPRVIYDRSTEDYYGDPGDFLQKRNNFDRYALWFSNDGKKLFLQGEGYSPEGNKPFVDEFDLKSFKTKRLWQADGISTYESIVRVVDPSKIQLITSIEEKTVNPNYFMRTGKKLRALTQFPNPYASFMKVSKEQVRYKRADGVDLSATLYLPAGYDAARDGRLPVLMWAYPREFKDAQQAGQLKESPHTFVQLYYGSPVYWAARGYAIIDDADFPIIGEGLTEPNDLFVEQLVANAAAAIDYAVSRGVADASRVAIGGHSYGAFMTANLMAHSDLFAAGIARSGAYNRTLTPFGFQAEERTFWEAPEVYFKMSPFVNADKINEPLLLIHGDADNNPGTFTLQSERLFGAIKGLGGTARLVLLPYESHGYSARENVLHMLWETDEWLEKYVKKVKSEE